VSAPIHLVVMGVAGCGKSAVGRRVADALGLPLIEGDDFHPPSNIAKMRQGVPLTDADRAGWLSELGLQLAARPQGAVLACSALKRSYRDTLRAAVPRLHFLHLGIGQDEALARVGARSGHFDPPALVASQFAALEDPAGEPGVQVADGTESVAAIAAEAVAWLRQEFNNP
jgi:gluconokinase